MVFVKTKFKHGTRRILQSFEIGGDVESSVCDAVAWKSNKGRIAESSVTNDGVRR